MKKAIISGATSFIGLSLIRELQECGYRIYAVTRPGSSRIGILQGIGGDNIRIIECALDSITDLAEIVQSLDDTEIDEFYHIAWNSGFDNARYNTEGQMANVKYTMDAMRTAIELGCCKFIGIGSQAECGLVSRPIDSATCDNPLNAYAEAKCETYRRCCELSNEIGISFYWPRLLSAYGPYDRPGTLIMSCIRACMEQDHIALSGGEQIWDYVYVDDVADALIHIADRGIPKKKYSIASGSGRPLKEYIRTIADEFGYPELMSGIGERPYSGQEVMYLVGDVTELKADTGKVFDTDFSGHIRYMKEHISEGVIC